MNNQTEELNIRLAEAGIELAEYASYSEIVGGITTNREAIRKWCDEIYSLKAELSKVEAKEQSK